MRSANAVVLMKYLKLRLEEGDEQIVNMKAQKQQYKEAMPMFDHEEETKQQKIGSKPIQQSFETMQITNKTV